MASFVSLSERNLLTLLAHLSQSERPNPMLVGGYVYRGGAVVDGVALVLRSEPNQVHYAEREAAGEPAGEIQPRTEAAIRWAEAREEQAEDRELQ